MKKKKTYSAYKSNKTVLVKKAGRKKGKEGANEKLVIYKRRRDNSGIVVIKRNEKASPNAKRQTRLHDGGNETCTCINMKEDMERKPDHEILTLSQCEM